MRSKVVEMLKEWDAVAVENPQACPGTPDVNFVHGWVELKKLPSWPKRATTPVRLPHFTPQQRVWHQRRWKAGGAVWMLLQVERDWLLFEGHKSKKSYGIGVTLNKDELFLLADATSTTGMNKEKLKSWLVRIDYSKW